MDRPARFSIYSAHELENKYNFRTVAILSLGDIPVLLRQDPEGLLASEPVDPYYESAYLEKEKLKIAPSSQYAIPGIDVDQVSFYQLELKAGIKTRWTERTVGPDEITLTVSVIDLINFSKTTIDLTEPELLDLFSPADTKRNVTFFRLDTLQQELIGIVIRRNTPLLLFLPPLNDGSQLSPISGLIRFLEEVYTRLLEHRTDTQNQVDSLVFDAMLPTKGYLNFVAAANKKKHAEVHRKLYQIQALLLALHADEKLGLEDPKLLAHAPFLKPIQHKTGLAGLAGKKEIISSIAIDSSIWESLIETVKPGFITTPPRVSKPRPVTTLSTTPARVLTEKQKAFQEVQPLNQLLLEALSYFKTTPPEQITLKQILDFHSVLQKLLDTALAYTQKRPRGAPPTTPTLSLVTPNTQVVQLGHLNDGYIFSFLTGDQPLESKDKIARAFTVWTKFVPPIFQETHSRSERSLTQLSSNTIFLARHPEIKTNLLPSLASIQREVYVGELTHLLLTLQILYVLWYRLQELAKNGQAVEIDNFVNYCRNTFEDLLNLSQTIQQKN